MIRKKKSMKKRCGGASIWRLRTGLQGEGDIEDVEDVERQWAPALPDAERDEASHESLHSASQFAGKLTPYQHSVSMAHSDSFGLNCNRQFLTHSAMAHWSPLSIQNRASAGWATNIRPSNHYSTLIPIQSVPNFPVPIYCSLLSWSFQMSSDDSVRLAPFNQLSFPFPRFSMYLC